MRWSGTSSLFILASFLGLALAFVLPGLPARAQDTTANLEELEFDPDQLEGPSDEVGNLAAIELVKAIERHAQRARLDPKARKARDLHFTFLKERLDLRKVSAAVDAAESLLAARRIVQALGTIVASKGPPFQEVPDLLLDLLGTGPVSFRAAVVEALTALARWEQGQRNGRNGASTPHNGNGHGAKKSALLERLGGIIQHNDPPSAAVLEDACVILWTCDGKRFLSYVIGGLALNRNRSPLVLNLYFRELRRRLVIDFPSAEGWQAWWAENKNQTFEEILLGCQRKLSTEATAVWRRVLKRLRETGDAERVLAEIEETLQNAYTLELRLTAVEALGEFADWLRDLKLAGAGVDAGAEEGARLRLLTRGCRLLLDLARGSERAFERPQVTRTALSTLRRYQGVLESTPELHQGVSALVLGQLQRLQPVLEGSKFPDAELRADLLEAVRTAGALRVTEARDVVEELLGNRLFAKDLELLVAATLSLGRLVGGSMSLETASLLQVLFQSPRPSSDEALLKSYRELRRACVSALNAKPEKEEVRTLMRKLFERCLFEEEDRELRIPAILGLGTLAQAKDDQALRFLVSVVEKPSGFETAEVIAALDSIAYVGGRVAISQFVAFLRARDTLLAKDKVLVDYLGRKWLTLLKGEDVETAAWLLRELESLSLESDALGLLQQGIRLCQEPDVKELLSPKNLDLADNLRPRWEAALTQARALDLVGEEAAAGDILRGLADFLDKNAGAREKIPREGVVRLEDQQLVVQRRAALRKRFLAKGKEADEPASLVVEIEKLLGQARNPGARWQELRWIERQLSSVELSETGKAVEIHDLWLKFLRSEKGAAGFTGLPEGFRERYLRRMEALQAAEKAPGRPPVPASAKQRP